MDWADFSLIVLTLFSSLIIGYLFLTRAKVEESLAVPAIQLKNTVPPKLASDGFTGWQGKYQPSFVAPDAEILIVDDNEMNLLVAQKLLQATLVKIDTADSGTACLEKLAQKRYDLIFLDQLMPEMDGLETLEIAQEMEGNLNKNTPFIALTAVKAREKFLSRGFADYLGKPVEAELLELILLTYLPLEKIHSV